MFRGALLKVNIKKDKVIITNESKQIITLVVDGDNYTIKGESEVTI
jgi:trehalose/maltose hydrolase-like predicted phosphorylase